MQKIFFLCIALFLIHINTAAQNCNFNFRGKVTDFHVDTPIIGASIQLLNLNKFTTSNLDGFFEFKGLCEGKIELEIQHIACETRKITIHLKNNLFKEIFLEHHLEELNEVIVTTNSKTATTSIEQTIKEDVLENYTDKSLGDALKSISGVSSLTTGSTIVKPMIHGLHSSRVLIINNNVRLFDQEWGDEHAPNFDLNSSNRIDVIKGANTLKYGNDAIGGLILIRGKKYAAKDSVFGKSSISLNSNGFGGNINTEIVKTYSTGYYGKFQTSYKRFGDFRAPDYYLTNTGMGNLNASLRFGYNSFEKGFEAYYSIVNNNFGILQLSHIGNVNDLVQAINSSEPRNTEDFSHKIENPKQTILHHLGKIEAYKRFKGFGKLSVQYDFQLNRRKEYDLGRGNRENTPVIDLRLFTTSIQTNLHIDFLPNVKFDVGLLGRFQQNNAVAGTRSRPLIPDYEKIDAAVYSIGNYKIDETTEINAGIRYDYSSIDANKTYLLADWKKYNFDQLFPEFEGEIDNTRIKTNPKFTFHNVSASLNFSKRWKNELTFLINYGLGNRVPNPSELYSDGVHHSNARFEIGYLNIKKEIANKFNFSLERKNDDFGFIISPYYKRINGFIQLIPTGITTTIKGAFPVWEYDQVNAQIFGIDIDINKKINSQLDYLGNISLIKGENITQDIPLIHMPSTNFSNRIVYTNKQWHDLTFSLRNTTVLRQNDYPNYNFNTFNPTTQQEVFVDISSPTPAYSLFDFSASATLKTSHKGSLKLEFNIENILNVSYREYLNRFRFFADELGRNFNIKIKINY
ncbi:MAG: TonB-dependent receptor [Polaribacter sp.]|jgi:iron complex outermembrane receptor protein|nr:TonB-dependent receptor [Polaribacter sp.]